MQCGCRSLFALIRDIGKMKGNTAVEEVEKEDSCASRANLLLLALHKPRHVCDG